jgi:hypothetical protein
MKPFKLVHCEYLLAGSRHLWTRCECVSESKQVRIFEQKTQPKKKRRLGSPDPAPFNRPGYSEIMDPNDCADVIQVISMLGRSSSSILAPALPSMK